MKKYDVAVIGGGFAGSAAALAAARGGASVILVDKANCLGGAPCGCLVQPFMPYSTQVNGKCVKLCEGIFGEITDKLEQMSHEIDGEKRFDEIANRLRRAGHEIDDEKKEDAPATKFHEEYLKIILNRMMCEAGVDVLFHAYLTRVACKDGRVHTVTVTNHTDAIEIQADYFIDATGNADLTAMSGFPCRLGREGDGLCQPMTLCFRLANVNKEKYLALPSGFIDNLYRRFQREGKIKNIREDVLIFDNLIDGVLHFNSTRVVKHNPVDALDVTKAEMQAREQVLELFLFMKEHIPGFEKSQLLMTAAEIGVRESRMVDGEYVLTGEDLKACKQFEDTIAIGNYDIDIHNPEGSGTSHYYFKNGEYYSIPYRSLIPKDAKNLLVAGRCISTDHAAQASIRIMPIVCCIGEAAGTACAIARKHAADVKQVDVQELQAMLRENGAVLGIE